MTEAPERGGGTQFDAILARLSNVRRSGDHFRSLCPAHDADGKHSGQKSVNDLAVREGRRGVLFRCYAGCSVNEVRLALGLSWKEMFWEGVEIEGSPPPIDKRGQALEAITAAARLVDEPDATANLRRLRGWSLTAMKNLGVGWDGERLTIPIEDEKGKAHDVLRYDPMAGRLKMLAGRGKSRYPFPAPEKVETKFRSRGLFLVEGEGTALSLASVGLPVVALPGAIARASGDVHRPGHFEGVGWHKAWARRFRKFGRIWLFPDADDVGRNLMRTVEFDLFSDGHARPVIVDLGGPKGYDLGDLLQPTSTLELRRQGRNIVRMLAETATRQIDQLDLARELAFAWNGALLDQAPVKPEVPAEPVWHEPDLVQTSGEIGWV